LIPKTQEEKEQYFGRGAKPLSIGMGAETSVKKFKTQSWDSCVNIVLVEGKNLITKDDIGSSDTYVKFKLGNEKYKSRVIPKSSNPVWAEQFALHTYPDQSKVLEVSVFGKDEFFGKFTINLNEMTKEETHKIWRNLEETGSILLLLTISATLGSEAISDLNTCEYNYVHENKIAKKYNLLKSFKDIDDIGHLTVKVFRAESLAAADIGGKSDPFCVLELVNDRLQTNTEYKTLSPEWNKIYSFQVKDIHSVLEITVYDEDRDKTMEFLGKVAIPLLKIKSGEKKWYALKDKKLLNRAKGQILLEMYLSINSVSIIYYFYKY
jgi:Ca2+-dependent lipid-binding protein